jgi:hypothetical protein
MQLVQPPTLDELCEKPYTLTGWSHERSAKITPANPVLGLVLRLSTQSQTWHQNSGWKMRWFTPGFRRRCAMYLRKSFSERPVKIKASS